MTILVWWSIAALIVSILFGMAFEKDDEQADDEQEDADTDESDTDYHGGRDELDDKLDDPRHGQARYINR
jgi:hypothetical protein